MNNDTARRLLTENQHLRAFVLRVAEDASSKLGLDAKALLAALDASPVCRDCNDTGMRDSGGVQPWGESIFVPCDCKAAPVAPPFNPETQAQIAAVMLQHGTPEQRAQAMQWVNPAPNAAQAPNPNSVTVSVGAAPVAPPVESQHLANVRAVCDVLTNPDLLAAATAPQPQPAQSYRGPLRTPAGDPSWIPRSVAPPQGQRVRVLMDAGGVGNPLHPGHPHGKWEEETEVWNSGGPAGATFACEIGQTGHVTHWMQDGAKAAGGGNG